MNYRRKMIFPVAGMVILLGYAILSFCQMTAKARVTSFTGGMFEASGVVHAPGTDGVLFVDDGRPAESF